MNIIEMMNKQMTREGQQRHADPTGIRPFVGGQATKPDELSPIFRMASEPISKPNDKEPGSKLGPGLRTRFARRPHHGFHFGLDLAGVLIASVRLLLQGRSTTSSRRTSICTFFDGGAKRPIGNSPVSIS